MTSEKEQLDKNEEIPIFKSWKTHYLVVLGIHALVIALLSWLTILF
jgi:hypothetical protein